MAQKKMSAKMQELKQQQMEREQNPLNAELIEKLKELVDMQYYKNKCEILKKAREAKAKKAQARKAQNCSDKEHTNWETQKVGGNA